MPREPLEARVARIEEAISGFREILREDRQDSKEYRADVISRLDKLAQGLQSTGTAVANLALEKCGERLGQHDRQLDDMNRAIEELKSRTKNLPTMEAEVMFWRRVLGGGFHALWKIAGFLIGSAGIGAALVKWVFH